MTRWTDHQGHQWPITGHECAQCGLPLIKTTLNQATHPGCEAVTVDE